MVCFICASLRLVILQRGVVCFAVLYWSDDGMVNMEIPLLLGAATTSLDEYPVSLYSEHHHLD